MQNDYRLDQVTLPPLSFKKRQIAYVKILSEINLSERVKTGEDNRNQANTCKVVDLQTGELYILICPSLMVSALLDNAEDYVDNCYEIRVSKDKVEGKLYKAVDVFRISADHDYSKLPITIEDARPDVKK